MTNILAAVVITGSSSLVILVGEQLTLKALNLHESFCKLLVLKILVMLHSVGIFEMMSPVSIRDNKKIVTAFLRHFEGNDSEISDLLILVFNILWTPIEIRYCCKDTPMFCLENKKGTVN